MLKRIRRAKNFHSRLSVIYILFLSFMAVLSFTGCSEKRQGKEMPDRNQINPEAGIRIEENREQGKIITGQKNNKETFQIPLPDYYTVLLNQTDFCDMTGDSRAEMCVGLDIGNNIASDLNAIHVFDSISLKQLFPTKDKTSFYSGKIVRPEEDGFPEYAIDYESFSKVRSIAFTEEKSLIGWKDDRFVTLRYHKKLMALEETNLTAVFLEDYSRYEKTSALKLTVEKIWDEGLQTGDVKVQDMIVELGADADWAAVDRKIEDNDLIFLESRDGGELEMVIRPFEDAPNDFNDIVYLWDEGKKLFVPANAMVESGSINTGKTGNREEQSENLGETLWNEMLLEEEEIETFLSSRGFPPEEKPPIYRRFDEEGNLQIAFYYDESACSGAGYRIDFFECKGFWFDGYSRCSRKDDKFLTGCDAGAGADLVEDYKELCEYNPSGQPVLYRSEGKLNWLKDKPGRYPIVEIRYDYREDGTLRKRDYYYNPYIFGTTNSTGMSCYDTLERLEYNYSYITHGSVEKYYIYQEDSMEPSYCLTHDSLGEGWFAKYE